MCHTLYIVVGYTHTQNITYKSAHPITIFHMKLIFLKNKNSKILVCLIIIMSCHQHGYPWPSLATSPYHSSPSAGLQNYILCLHIAAVCKFELVILLLLGHMWGSIGVHHLRAHPCLSIYSYLPTPPLGQDMTQGQYF